MCASDAIRKMVASARLVSRRGLRASRARARTIVHYGVARCVRASSFSGSPRYIARGAILRRASKQAIIRYASRMSIAVKYPPRRR